MFLRLVARFFSALASMMGFGNRGTSKSDSDPRTQELIEVFKSENWTLGSALGNGVSGGVFSIKTGHLFNKKTYALKIFKDRFTYENERNIMEELRNISYFPQLIQCKLGVNCHFIVMSQQLCDVSKMMSLMKEKKFSIMTATKVFKECLEALRVMHEKSLLHRDVKPSNILISMDGRRVLLSDFGHSAKYASDGREIYSPYFIGTPAFASLNVQAYFEPTPRDDLLSLFYTGVCMLGALPWVDCTDPICIMFRKTFAVDHIPTLPNEYWIIYNYLSSVKQHETPHYVWVMQQLDALMDQQYENKERKYDWELIKPGKCGEEIIQKMHKHRKPRWSFFSLF
ncbi:putative serine/threonine-protein kinase [Trichinella pseudospiralis]|uniref:non-specific serine/threonine protein kinase n=1 Tax=Trichinella pseudospiralis TaxID=6337 RepID=A0A0V1FX46_TRIPS|nr:putative serine/threonine-protein kinase [Trichinella pseudospiralis]